MFCKNCGNQVADTDNVCANCGTRLKEAAPAAPAAPAKPAAQGTGDLKQYAGIIGLVVGAIAFIFALMNFFGWYDVSIGDASGSVSDLYDVDNYGMTLIANILYGIILLAAAAVAVLFGLKKMNNMPYYDQFIAKLPMADKPLLLAGGLMVAGAVVQFILYMMTGGEYSVMGYTVEMESASVGWVTWVALIIGAGAAAYDYLILNKKTN